MRRSAALYGIIDTSTLQVQFARGGHPSPALISADGQIRDVTVDGGLLGIFPAETYDTCTVQLQPGDRLLVFTDGLEVAFWSDKNFDTMRWREEIYERRMLPSAELLSSLVEQMDKHTGSLRPKDDLTIILIEAKKD